MSDDKPDKIKVAILNAAVELLSMASAFDLIPYNPHAPSGTIRQVTITRRRTNPEAWAITDGTCVLARDGWWIVERSPSNREPDHLDATRWPTAPDAIAFARDHMEKYPGGYKHEQLYYAGES